MHNNAIEYWYPKIKDIVPTPRTIIIPAKRKWDKTGEYLYVPKKYVNNIVEQAQNFTFPLFLRGSDSSIKHDWKDTCFVESEKDLKKHIHRIAHESEMLDIFGGVPTTSFALREFIKMNTGFTAFWGKLPINPERRYFINNGKVVCHHIYWFEDSIRNPSIENWKDILKIMNKETQNEIDLLTGYAEKVGKNFKGYWSVDFCEAKNGRWYCIDMAMGNRSYHPKCDKNLTNQKL